MVCSTLKKLVLVEEVGMGDEKNVNYMGIIFVFWDSTKSSTAISYLVVVPIFPD